MQHVTQHGNRSEQEQHLSIDFCIGKYRIVLGGVVLTLEPHLGEFVGLAGLEQEGARSDVGSLAFKDGRAAFDCAVSKLKEILGA